MVFLVEYDLSFQMIKHFFFQFNENLFLKLLQNGNCARIELYL